MVALPEPQGDPLPPPSVPGISNAITATDTSTAGSLAYDASVSNTGTQTAPALALTSTPVQTLTPSNSQPPATPTSSPSPAPSAASNTSTPISMGTVVGSCVAAFIGVTALICVALWFYRRYNRALNKRAQSRRAFATHRNIHSEAERRRSHLEPWDKLHDEDDKWEGAYQTKEVDNVGPMEKLTMFKKTPSVRTAWTHKSSDLPAFDPQAFAQFHPSIAESIASKRDEKTIQEENAILVLPNHSSTTVVPSLDMAIPTPAAVPSKLHKWETAEVMEYDTSQPSLVDPFEDTVERRDSLSNPFFNAREHSSAPESRSRSNSKSTIVAPLKLGKGKERAAVVENPFVDEQIPRPPILPTHALSESQSSVSSQQRALQSLIAALDISPEEVEERIRVASMQPSMVSDMSVYTDDGEGEEFTGSFTHPPQAEDRRHL